jgi:peptide/nickel transport system substrate-binding protein
VTRLISFLIKVEKALRSPRVLSRLRYLGWQWLQVRRMVFLTGVFTLTLFFSLIWGWQTMHERFATSAPQSGGTYREALAGRSEIINPLFSPANPVDADIVRLVYSGLLRRDVDGSLKPDLAESYTLSEDRLTYTVKLRRELRWQDDVVLTSRDVAFTVGLIQSKEYEGPLKAEWAGVTVEAKSDHELTFKLQAPYAFFPVGLTLPILPWHLLRDVPAQNAAFAAFNDNPVGSGPFEFASRKTIDDPDSAGGQVQEVTLRRSPFYHAKKPYLDRIVFKIYNSPRLAYQAYERRSVDGVAGIRAEDVGDAAKWDELRLLDRTLPQFSAVFYNTDAKGAPVADGKVRTALSHLIDRRALIKDALDGRAFPIYYPLLAGMTGYDPGLPRIGFDQGAAERLLDESGWVKGESGKRSKGGQPLKVTLVTGETEAYRAASAFIKKAWEGAGASVEVASAADDQLQDRYIRGRNYQVLLYGINLGATGDLYPFWHSSQKGARGLNLSNYSNATVDRSLEQARSSPDAADIRQKYDRAQKAWLADLPAQPLYTPIYTIGVDERVGGVRVGELTVPADRFATISEWYVRESRRL